VITGAHSILFAQDAERARAFFAEVLGLDSVDAGGGWLIFALPPAELAVHPTDRAGPMSSLYLMCDDIEAERARLAERGVDTDEVSDEGWGLLSAIEVPGYGKLGLYEPRHPVPHG
jgi:catechol 2,3-dioxygenase-like lactoylglutathione lyase family enzyme